MGSVQVGHLGVTPGVAEASDPGNWGQRELILTLMRAS